MPTISIIVPVYNVEKYLDRCVESILSQTFTDFELLLINDGSKDSSGEMCDEWAVKDSRIRVFHKENGGQSTARNLGLDNMRGKYVTFIDSDDAVHCQMLEILFNALKEENADISFCTNANFITQESPEDKVFADISREIYDYKNGVPTELDNDYPFGDTPWAKLYKSEIFTDLRFTEGIVYEDFFIRAFIVHSKEVKKVVYSKAQLYYYFTLSTSSSTMRSTLSEKKYYSIFYALDKHYDFYSANNCDYPASHTALVFAYKFIKASYLATLSKENKRLFWKYFRKYFFKVIRIPSKLMKFTWKLFYLSSVLPFKLCKPIYLKYMEPIYFEDANNL